MNPRMLTVVLLTALAGSATITARQALTLRLPGNNQGYEPVQPVAYSHRLHAGELQIPCGYCHSGAERSKHAGIPAASTCMNCHKVVTATMGAQRAEDEAARKAGRKPAQVVSPELQKLYDALGLNAKLERDPAKRPRPIEWVRIHKLPDFASFDHRPHVTAGVACQTCHGPIETMERVRKVESLSMGWCVNCHRTSAKQGVNGKPVAPSTDCSACHY